MPRGLYIPAYCLLNFRLNSVFTPECRKCMGIYKSKFFSLVPLALVFCTPFSTWWRRPHVCEYGHVSGARWGPAPSDGAWLTPMKHASPHAHVLTCQIWSLGRTVLAYLRRSAAGKMGPSGLAFQGHSRSLEQIRNSRLPCVIVLVSR